ncbi:MAG: IclR family transcriptional regulator [Desulfitobacterium hafniense]|nr:IclR family transcriptional regulator [Desulfitobacterium hafniense]
MRLKEKTHRKFVDFFEKMSRMYQGNEFELAYSDIQRETGAASVTLKRAIQALEVDGVIQVSPGRNSRYAKFKYLLEQPVDNSVGNNQQDQVVPVEQNVPVNNEASIKNEVNELVNLVDQLRRRIRTQEMAIALLQDRVAELEDKIRKQ